MATSRVYIGRLSRDARERDIERLFRGYGDIREITLKNGFGFVEFRDDKDAQDVVYDFNGRDFLGERLIVEMARGHRERLPRNDRQHDRYPDRSASGRNGPPTRTQHRIRVENLSSSVSWQDLKDHMRKAGEVTFADAHKYREGEGVVEFATSDGVKEALKLLDDTELRGRRIALRSDESSRGRRHDSRSPRHDRVPRDDDRNRRDSRSPRRDRGSRDEEDRHRHHSRSASPRNDRRLNDRHREDDHSPRDEPNHSPNGHESVPADNEEY